MAPALNHPAGVTFVDDGHGPVHVDAATYYGGGEAFIRSRTYSHVRRLVRRASCKFLMPLLQSHIHGYVPKRAPLFEEDTHMRARRMSHDEKSVTSPRRFLIDVEETIRVVLEQEDTDGDFQISITDAGPKMMALGTATSNGFKTFDVRVSAHVHNIVPLSV
jgi:alpha,alpha-trehalase